MKGLEGYKPNIGSLTYSSRMPTNNTDRTLKFLYFNTPIEEMQGIVVENGSENISAITLGIKIYKRLNDKGIITPLYAGNNNYFFMAGFDEDSIQLYGDGLGIRDDAIIKRNEDGKLVVIPRSKKVTPQLVQKVVNEINGRT